MGRAMPNPRFPFEVWDGLTPSNPDPNTDKAPDPEFGARYRAEIRALEEALLPLLEPLQRIVSYGPGNSILGVTDDGTELEYKVIVGGDGVTVNHDEGTITISAVGAEGLLLEATAGADIVQGQPVHLNGGGELVPAFAADSRFQVIGISTESVVSGETCKYNPDGRVGRADWTPITGSTLLEPGKRYYLSPDDVGQLTTVAPADPGQFLVKVGRAASTSVLDIEIGQSILL